MKKWREKRKEKWSQSPVGNWSESVAKLGKSTCGVCSSQSSSKCHVVRQPLNSTQGTVYTVFQRFVRENPLVSVLWSFLTTSTGTTVSTSSSTATSFASTTTSGCLHLLLSKRLPLHLWVLRSNPRKRGKMAHWPCNWRHKNIQQFIVQITDVKFLGWVDNLKPLWTQETTLFFFRDGFFYNPEIKGTFFKLLPLSAPVKHTT